jgi:hypothetical protein
MGSGPLGVAESNSVAPLNELTFRAPLQDRLRNGHGLLGVSFFNRVREPSSKYGSWMSCGKRTCSSATSESSQFASSSEPAAICHCDCVTDNLSKVCFNDSIESGSSCTPTYP